MLVTWENEAYLILKEHWADQFEIVMPSLSILAEPPVTVVEDIVRQRGTAEVAKAYLEYLYSPEGQELAAKHHYRPRDQAVLAKHAKDFAPVQLFTIDEVFGGWDKAQNTHFVDGGIFDQIYSSK